ncbi:hypothetical protein [Actinomadura rupiterrae]|uniref:hypothetical protein n=1 Tax=Actinomadura rupiterrae TaxID=559627 RepID=UPI0020A53B4F|nr:hypothetical protein [Actinomadura rupiterrae]MCP2336676.1 hypothetical protein [Actinomadura rupiterrae]
MKRAVVAVVGTVVLTVVAVFSVVSAVRDGRAVGDARLSLARGPGLVALSSSAESRGRAVSVSGGRHALTGLTCERLYAANGTGLCLRLAKGFTTYQLVVLDSALREKRTIPLVGIPNRARVSPSGRMVAWTVFVTGDSYNGGRFSTRVGILDTWTQALVPTLEDWAISVGGVRRRVPDANFWGVTFTRDDRRFYATMSTGGHRYLVEGDLAARTIRTLHDNVECPSLSPDGKRVAFKSAVGGDPSRGWRLSVLDLATMRATPLAETRSVDDQAAWLDDRTVAYAIARGRGNSDVWTVPADGTGTPKLLLHDAYSPSPLR